MSDGQSEYPATMSALMTRIQASREQLETRIASLGEDSFTTVMANGWTLRDQLLHLAAWEASLSGILRGDPRGPAMGLDPSLFEGEWDVDAVNATLLEVHRELSDGAVSAWFAAAHDEVLGLLATLEDGDLQRPFSWFQPYPGASDAPIAGWIAGDTFLHYEEHLGLLPD